MIKRWKELNWWKSGECQVIDEKLKDLGKGNFNPSKEKVYAAMDQVPFDRVRVVFAGQDPYPDPAFATGIAFSIPEVHKEFNFPPTLVNVLKEYVNDLGHPFPKNGNLEKWCEQGVFMWNVIPTCEPFKSLSHDSWGEYEYLNKEIFEELDKKNSVCFILLGGRARSYAKYLSKDTMLIETSHPSPRGSVNSKVPFLGSRVFSTTNDYLAERGLPPIDWRL